jgi:hypothetical protein
VDAKRLVRTGYDKAAQAYTRHRLDHVDPDVVRLIDDVVDVDDRPSHGRAPFVLARRPA